MNYAPNVPLFGQKGGFWQLVIECLVDRGKALKSQRRSDQCVQPESSVVVSALWLRGRPLENIESGDVPQLHWEPELEANPDELYFRTLVDAASTEAVKLTWCWLCYEYFDDWAEHLQGECHCSRKGLFFASSPEERKIFEKKRRNGRA